MTAPYRHRSTGPVRSVASTLRRMVPRSVGFTLDRSGLLSWFLKEVGTVVAFHRVNDQTAGDGLTVSPSVFEAYCRFFRRHFEVVPFGELVRRLEEGEPTGGTLAITFDDGYLDNREVAAPILRSLGLSATFFVSTGFVGTERVASWDRDVGPAPAWMDWDDVRALHSQGFEIGAHTVNHLNLAEAPERVVRDELTASRRTLEQVLGVTVDLFAYPFGGPEHVTDRVRALVREAGFRSCPSCHGGLNPPGADPFFLNRVPIDRWFSSPSHFGGSVALRKA